MTAKLAVVLGLCLAARFDAQTSTTSTVPVPPPGSIAPAASPQPRPTTGTGVVVGRVLDMGSGQPLGGAMVTIGGTAMSTTVVAFGGGPLLTTSIPGAIDGSQRSSDLRVLTDSQGRFAFLDLPKGSFQFSVSATGYISGGYGQRRPSGAPQPLELGDGQRISDLTLPVWRYAAISGTVTDEAGEPVVGVTVNALRRQVTAGRRRLSSAGFNPSGRTDDRGVYRISLLMPGEYVIAIPVTQNSKSLTMVEEVRAGATLAESYARPADPSTLPGSAAALLAGNQVLEITRGFVPPAAPPSGRTWMYQTVFHPAARTPAEATTVTVGSGEERTNIDLNLRLTLTSRVSGTISGPSGPLVRATVRLVPAGLDLLSSETPFETAVTTTDGTGAFSLIGVPPGQYVLRAVQVPPSASGRGTPPASGSTPAGPFLYLNQPVTVGDDDVSRLALVMRPGASLSGSLQFDGAREHPVPDLFRNITVSLVSSDARSISGASFSSRVTFDATGRITTAGVAPGRYLVSAGGALAGWSFKSAMFEGRDISTTPIEIEGGDISGVVFVFSDRSSEIAGTVQNATGNDGDAIVLMFPVDERGWIENGNSPRRMKTMRTSKTGGFSIAAVPEGEYYVVAVRDVVADDWPDPAFLLGLRGQATRVSIVDGDRKTVNLRTVR